MRIILASSSIYRRDMLTRLGLPFTCQSPDIDETPHPDEQPAALSLRLAREKAARISTLNPGALVIGSDQVATLGTDAIGKPGDHAGAVRQLRALSGREVAFHSALCVTDGQKTLCSDIITHCLFRTLDDAEIEHYLRTETPYDTAGSAKAEGLGIALMQSMRSDDPTAIIGLPLIELCSMLRRFGLNPLLPSLPTTFA
ncbi:Maf family nucleotide pyrophosphatase [Alcaligenes sp. SDU_A2]|uniref:Maf family nucleotide pyrophosphatase n=1 Tax=Alcaligenes sp. SDU_A2 TaxID=3136634 RepID=UPI00311D368F